ncbi:MAG: lytic transglycosylase domain-containing protein [Clostridiales bacterium]|nr:lytic transglycosylase domain-containing protein [Clostridiales bacterium]
MFLLVAAVSVIFPNRYKAETECAASVYGVREELIRGIIWTESKYHSDAVSRAGAVGLMQLMPDTAQWLAAMQDLPYKAGDLFDPAYNIRLGTYYIGYLLEKFEDEKLALAAYNAGEGTVRRWLNEGKTEPVYQETRDYVDRVLFCQKMYKIRLFS